MPNNPRSLKSRELRALMDEGMDEPQARFIRQMCQLHGMPVSEAIKKVRTSGRAKAIRAQYETFPLETKAKIHEIIEAQLKAGPAHFEFYSNALHDIHHPEDAVRRKAGAN